MEEVWGIYVLSQVVLISSTKPILSSISLTADQKKKHFTQNFLNNFFINFDLNLTQTQTLTRKLTLI